MTRVLIVGNMADKIGVTAQLARDAGFQVSQANSIDGAVETLRGGREIDLAMVDIKLGIEEFIRKMERQENRPPIIACGEDIKTPAEIIALKQRYMLLPPRIDHFKKIILESVAEPAAQARTPQNPFPSSLPAIPFICADSKTTNMVAQIPLIAKSRASVLITGESGTGKEVLAKTIHILSGLPSHKFHAFNCAAIPDHLLESELFGYEKGAFTGALNRKIGKFEEASGGTLLLDEISEMDLRLQAKLLRVLQEQEVDRLGGNKPVKINVRIVATTNRHIMDFIKQGKFREDLFYRLNVFQINLPPLRDRSDDIAVLAKYFTKKYCDQYGKPLLTVSDGAIAKMQQHQFHGNVRELENTIHRAVVISDGAELTAEHLHLLSWT